MSFREWYKIVRQETVLYFPICYWTKAELLSWWRSKRGVK